ncbi:MAG: transaldolase family protein [Candidatus Woesearchaeota archaeon]|nr:transaldolase family protein [Candidatus Woesearchaeota archaeon]
MKPENLRTKIFLDSGDPNETRQIMGILGFLDGQTTNPTLISKNPIARERFEKGEKFAKEEIYAFYHEVVDEISRLIPSGSVSIEVYADADISSSEMIKEASEMYEWIPNAHIKLPITREGLKAAEQSIKENMRVNMTLCFSQEQASAVYAATKGASKGNVFVSPFIGRLDDIGENGMGLIKNILEMYKNGDKHVEVLTASVRNIEHLLCALHLGSDIVTAPYKLLKEWSEIGMPMPNDYICKSNGLKEIAYQNIDLKKNWPDFNISHQLTDKGIERFSNDWNALIK